MAQWNTHANGDLNYRYNAGLGSGSNLLLPKANYHLYGTPESEGNIRYPSLRFQPANQSDAFENFCPDYWEWWFDNIGKCEGSKKFHLRVGDENSRTFLERMTFESKDRFAGVLNNYPANTLDIGGNLAVGYNMYDANSLNQAPANGLVVSGSTGLGTLVPGAKLGVNNNVAVGSTFANQAAPANSIAVQDKVLIGTNVLPTTSPDQDRAERLYVKDGNSLFKNGSVFVNGQTSTGNAVGVDSRTSVSGYVPGANSFVVESTQEAVESAVSIQAIGQNTGGFYPDGTTALKVSSNDSQYSTGLHVYASNLGTSGFSKSVGTSLLVSSNGETEGIRMSVTGLGGVSKGIFGTVSGTSNVDGIRLDVTSLGNVYGCNFNTYGADYNVAVNGSANGTNSTTSTNIGVRGYATGSTNTTQGTTGQNYAIFGETLDPNATNTTSWAGYFNGRSYTAGNQWQPSDFNLKRSIKTEKVNLYNFKSLEPKIYEYDHVKFPQMGFERNKQFGFIAQELEEHFPNLVTLVTHPAYYDSTGKKIHEAVTFKAVNYTGLIPVLWSVVQQQQTEIDKLKELTGSAKPGGINIEVESVLHQNKPNPFNENTEIAFELAEGFKQAGIYIYNMNGLQIQKHDIAKAGVGKLIVEGRSLKAGMYLYSLIVDGKEVDTKRMILTK